MDGSEDPYYQPQKEEEEDEVEGDPEPDADDEGATHGIPICRVSLSWRSSGHITVVQIRKACSGGSLV